MTLKIYQVDAFSETIFGGNPAAICVLDAWLDEGLMQRIAMENNLSETAFLVADRDSFQIRWFTPTVEVALCGHATLAAAHVLFSHCAHKENTIRFKSRERGILTVEKRPGGLLELDFPAENVQPTQAPDGLIAGMGKEPEFVLKGLTDYMLVYPTEQDILDLSPDFGTLRHLPCRGIMATAPGSTADFVSRFFGPGSGIDEDPVTGSAHTLLIPYWADRLGKDRMAARQLSARGGALQTALVGDRVKIGGQAVTYMIGEIFLDN